MVTQYQSYEFFLHLVQPENLDFTMSHMLGLIGSVGNLMLEVGIPGYILLYCCQPLQPLHPQERGDLREADSGPEDLERPGNVPDLEQKMDGLMARKAELPDDLACFLQQQRQARMKTTMRSFPTSMDVEQERQELALKRKRTAQEVRDASNGGYL